MQLSLHSDERQKSVSRQSLDPKCGLRRRVGQKLIPIHMLYENGGSALYEEIEQHPDYYLYAAEKQLLEQNANEIVQRIRPGAVLIELGCGDCTKTAILIEALARREGRVDFVGIDASSEGLARGKAMLAGRSNVHVVTIHDNFFDGLSLATQLYRDRDLCVLLLGSTLGNMTFHDAQLFLHNMVEILAPYAGRVGFQIVLGLDMWKDKDRLRRAYDNEITRRFALNGLRNALLNVAQDFPFDMKDWRYLVHVNETTSQVEMFAQALKSHRAPGVRIERGETILIEISHKFTPGELESLCHGCDVVGSFGDEYKLVMLSSTTATASNPWMKYSDKQVDDIDRVARLDYRAFVHAYDWKSLGSAQLSILDVGCGSGALPRLLRSSSGASRWFAERIDSYDILDISANSLRIAAERIPFYVDRKFHTGIQDFSSSTHFAEARSRGYDLVWSIHGVTAVRAQDLWCSLLNMLSCVKLGGRLIIVMSDRESHYAALDRAYLQDRRDDAGSMREPFLVAEQVIDLLTENGIAHDVVGIRTDHVFSPADQESWRHFNAWCVYDHSFDVRRGGPAVTRYVESLWDAWMGGYRLRLSAMAITVRRDWLTVLRWLVRQPGFSLPTLGTGDDTRAREVLEKHTSQRREIISHFKAEGVLGQLVARTGGTLRILSLGCGDGVMDRALLESCLPPDFDGSVFYAGVDTDQNQVERCIRTMSLACQRGISKAKMEATALSPSAFDRSYSHGGFDCVLMMHALYDVEDYRETIRWGLDHVSTGGKLIIWQAPDEDLSQLSGVFWAPQHQHRIPRAGDIEQHLSAEGLKFTVHRIDAALTLGERGVADERRDVLSFLLRVDSTRLPAAIQEAVEECVDFMRMPDGAIPHPVCCLIITKS
jgi:uncharacterized SAM-dependent methyltransferase/2-polyprenyl-3-methyl-5-hydroxy-6-metoxy-1,4-benzoquinol methylase